jgi:hypothetical protein
LLDENPKDQQHKPIVSNAQLLPFKATQQRCTFHAQAQNVESIVIGVKAIVTK